MKITFAALMTLLLVFSAGRQYQLCKHHSGTVHVFTGSQKCDGEHSHAMSCAHPHHDESHGDHHSHHESSGEHHEPCSHEVVIAEKDKATTSGKTFVAQSSLIAILPAEPFSVGSWASSSKQLLSHPQGRGPPGMDSTLRRFADCIRLTI